MDLTYFSEWGHVYLIHFGAWVAFAFGATVHKNGLPQPKQIPKLLLSAVILASVVAVFSSHSHAHYISHFVKK
jgi:hypothetical protein